MNTVDVGESLSFLREVKKSFKELHDTENAREELETIAKVSRYFTCFFLVSPTMLNFFEIVVFAGVQLFVGKRMQQVPRTETCRRKLCALITGSVYPQYSAALCPVQATIHAVPLIRGIEEEARGRRRVGISLQAASSSRQW